MKTKIATALSLVGVLSAGSAAALVNTTILDSGPTKSGQSAAVPEQVASTSRADASTTSSSSTIASTLPASTIASTITSTTTSTTPSTVPSTLVVTVPAAAPTGLLTTFNVGDAGAVTVDVINGLLMIVSSTPNPGWQVAKSEQKIEENKVEVYFKSATVQIEFEATFVNGQIVPDVSSSAANGTVSGGTVAGGTEQSTIDDDDDTDNTIVDDDDDTDNTIVDDDDDDRDDDRDDD